MRSLDAEEAAILAERFLSPEFGATVLRAVTENPDGYIDQREEAEQVMVASLKTTETDANSVWDARHKLALERMNNSGFAEKYGVFAEYIHGLGGETSPNQADAQDLAEGEKGPSITNDGIKRRRNIHDEPIDFMNDVLEYIQDRRKQSRDAIGPENYATALKFFSDIYAEFPSSHLDRKEIARVVNHAVHGFIKACKTDKPNFVEMGNMMASIATLPRDVFPADAVKAYLRITLEALPDFQPRMAGILYASVAKLPLEQCGPEAATLIDLATRMYGGFQHTGHLRMALRAVSQLPASPEADRAFATVLEYRNETERALDPEGAEEVNAYLLKIVAEVTDDMDLVHDAKSLAEVATSRAIFVYRQEKAKGNLTQRQLDRLKDIVNEAIKSYHEI